MKIVSQTSTKVKEARETAQAATIFTEDTTCVWPALKSGSIAFPSRR
jgi:hypothetical protein